MAEAKLNPRVDAGAPVTIRFGLTNNDLVVLATHQNLVLYSMHYGSFPPVDLSTEYRMQMLPLGAAMMHPLAPCARVQTISEVHEFATVIALAGCGPIKPNLDEMADKLAMPTAMIGHAHERYQNMFVYLHSAVGTCFDLSKVEQPAFHGSRSDPESASCTNWHERIVDPGFFLSEIRDPWVPILKCDLSDWAECLGPGAQQETETQAAKPASAGVGGAKASDSAKGSANAADVGGADDYLPVRKLVALFRGRARKLRDTGI